MAAPTGSTNTEILGKLDYLYKYETGLEKTSPVPEDVSVVDRWRTVFSSENIKISRNAVFYVQPMLSQSQGFDMFLDFLKSNNARLAINSLIAITNQVATVASILTEDHVRRIVALFDDTPENVTDILTFAVNATGDEKFVPMFVKTDGVSKIRRVLEQPDLTPAVQKLLAMTYFNVLRAKYNINEADAGCLVHLMLASKQKETTAYCLRSIATITGRDLDACLYLCNNNAVEPLIQHLRAQDGEIVKYSLVCLAAMVREDSCALEFARLDGLLCLPPHLQSNEVTIAKVALGVVVNLASKDDAISLLKQTLLETDFVQLILSRLTAEDADVRLRSAWALSNLMGNDGLQQLLLDSIGSLVKVLISPLERPDVKSKVAATLVNLTFFDSEARKIVVDHDALKPLILLAQEKNEASAGSLKTILNLSIEEKTAEVFIPGSSLSGLINAFVTFTDRPDLQTLAASTLENLALYKEVNEKLRQNGAITAALHVFKEQGPTWDQVRPRAVHMIRRLAINGKCRRDFQKGDGPTVLQNFLDTSHDEYLKEIVLEAITNMNFPHFEDDEPEFDLEEDSVEEYLKSHVFDDFEDTFVRQSVYIRNSSPSSSPTPARPLANTTPTFAVTEEASENNLGMDIETRVKSFHEGVHNKPTLTPPASPSSSPKTSGKQKRRSKGLFKRLSRRMKRKSQKMPAYVDPSTVEVGLPEPATNPKGRREKSYSALENPRTSHPPIRASSKSDAPGMMRPPTPQSNTNEEKSSSSTKVIAGIVITENQDEVKIKRAKQHFKRTKVAQELLDTEANYVRDLGTLVKRFQNPLLALCQGTDSFISAAEVRDIFSIVEILYGYNMMILEALNNKMSKWSTKQTLGDVFLLMSDFLKSYTTYVNNFDKAQATLNRAKTIPKFEKWLQKAEADPVCRGLNVYSLLIMPVQRIPRYTLLLRDLQKYTDKDHPDYAKLEEASEKVEKVSSFLNSQKKEAEDITKLLTATRCIIGAPMEKLVAPGRKIIEQYSVEMIDKQRYLGKLLVFNDAILYTRTKKQKEKFMDMTAYTNVVDLVKPAGNQLELELRDKRKAPKFQFADQQERDKCLNQIESECATKMFLPM